MGACAVPDIASLDVVHSKGCMLGVLATRMSCWCPCRLRPSEQLIIIPLFREHAEIGGFGVDFHPRVACGVPQVGF
jgi:hypothetical protein